LERSGDQKFTNRLGLGKVTFATRLLQAESAQSHTITVESICKELDEAVALAKSRGMANALVNVAALRAKLAGLGSERQIVEINDSASTFDNCQSAEQIARQWADSELDGMTNARWRLITEDDRNYLASIFLDFTSRTKAFLESVEARPSHTEQNPIITIAKQ
jgi:hypothetical protein